MAKVPQLARPLKKSEVKRRGCYLTNGHRLFRVLDSVDNMVFMEDCANPEGPVLQERAAALVRVGGPWRLVR